MRYEVGIAIQTGWIVWINGPYRAGVPDLVIFRHRLRQRLLLAKERVEADGGYGGEPKVVDTPHEMTLGSKKQARAKGIVRSRNETCNKRFKQFNCLNQTFRHNVKLHKEVFYAIAVLTQLSIERGGSPLFAVKYRTKRAPR